MPYKSKVAATDYAGKSKYVNAKGNTECVEFVRQVTDAPATPEWKQGIQVKGSKFSDITAGSAIATFDAKGKYPTDQLGKHAAIYISHDDKAIQVYDQWNSKGEVKPRPIRFNRPAGTSRSDNGDTFYVIN